MMTTRAAAQALGARHIGDDVTFTSVTTDSRALKAGALFVALRGERFDGHDFLAQAEAAGAVAALVDHANQSSALAQIVVEDTTLALGKLGQHWRRQFKLPLVALTGSVGKTTVKEMLASILRVVTNDADTVLATRGNLNNHIGMPLMLLELRAHHRYAVIEMGMNHAGEIRYLTQLAEPDVALINNAGSAHQEFFDTPDGIARAKGEIFEGLSEAGVAVFNADDAHAALWRGLSSQYKQIEFTVNENKAKETTVYASYTLHDFDSDIVLKTPAGAAQANVAAPGLHNVRNAVAASAAATALDITPALIARGLKNFHGVAGRLQRKAGLHGATIIDDTYNANPDSVRAAIDVLAKLPSRRLLVLGDMGELGDDAAEMHTRIGAYAQNAGLDALFTLGALSEQTTKAFGEHAKHYTQPEALIADVLAQLTPNTTVLVKGSRFMRMERVVAALTGTTETGAH